MPRRTTIGIIGWLLLIVGAGLFFFGPQEDTWYVVSAAGIRVGARVGRERGDELLGAVTPADVLRSGCELLANRRAVHVAERLVRVYLPEIQAFFARAWWGAIAEGLAMGGLVGLSVATSGVGVEFIYFQF